MPLQFVYDNIMKFTVIVFQQRNQYYWGFYKELEILMVNGDNKCYIYCTCVHNDINYV